MKNTHGGKREGSGRKPMFESSSKVIVQLPDEIIDKIPGKISTWIRELVIKELSKKI